MARSVRFETDWLALDRRERIAFFGGGIRGALPRDADVDRTGEALEALARAEAARQVGAGYREAGRSTNEPVLDPPLSSEGGPLHEKPIDGYPHLVVADDPERLREVLDAACANVRDAIVSRGAGLIADGLALRRWSWLHDDEAICMGCRALGQPCDPRPRDPELLARAGLYVYGHTGGDDRCPYVRIASPSIPADLADLETIVVKLARLVPLAIDFAEQDVFSPWRFVGCR
jgi:hypothetical protein